jgi:hypothetical protein
MAVPQPVQPFPDSSQSPDTTAELHQLRAHIKRSAHDLSNALGAVLNYTTFLDEDLRQHEAAQLYLPHLVNAANRALDLVGKLAAPVADAEPEDEDD